jgi:hypothetical protein
MENFYLVLFWRCSETDDTAAAKLVTVRSCTACTHQHPAAGKNISLKK